MSETETEKKPAKEAPKVVALSPAALSLQTHSYRLFNAFVPPETKKAHLTDPAFWPHASSKMAPGDEVRVLSDDLSFRAHLVVLYKQGKEIGMGLISYNTFKDEKKGLEVGENGYETKWGGPSYKWCIINPQGEYVKKNLQSKAIADRELADHLKALAR